MESSRKSWILDRLPLLCVLSVSAFVSVWGLWNEGLGNLYYAAGVQSMGQSLHAFFYNSLDSVGFISIDKPPLGLWVQVLFTRVLGFNGLALLLPQALAGIAATGLLHGMVGRRFGRTAGFASALILALTPILVAVDRNNTMDGLLVLLLVLASEQAIRAAERSSPRHLVLAGVFIGLGFNVKMLESFVIVPAIYLTYLLFSGRPSARRLMACLASFLLLTAISLSWIVAVDLTPPENRPYVGSSGTNSELALTFGNNGLGRLLGHAGTASTDSGTDGLRPPPGGPPAPGGDAVSPAGGGESGSPSAFRLFTRNNAGQIAWFLVPAFAASLFALFRLVAKRPHEEEAGRAAFGYFAFCFLPMLLYFSFSNGVVHRYYLAVFALPIAALCGIGLSLLQAGTGWRRFFLPLAFAVTAASQGFVQSLYPGWLPWVLPTAAVAFGIVSVVLLLDAIDGKRKSRWTALTAVLLILPGLWSATPMLYGDNTQLPIAGPELTASNGSFVRRPDLTDLVDFLVAERGSATYLAAVPSAMSLGAELILQSGEPVMVLGGFNGGDRPLTVAEFQRLVSEGSVRTAVLPEERGEAGKGPGAGGEILAWIRANGTRVDRTLPGGTVYRLGDEP